MSATALTSTLRRFSILNHLNFEFFCLIPKSPTHTGLICGKTLESNISSLGPFNYTMTQEHGVFLEMNGTPDTEETLEVVEEQEQHFREQQVNKI
jgi:hypothetical protein